MYFNRCSSPQNIYGNDISSTTLAGKISENAENSVKNDQMKEMCYFFTVGGGIGNVEHGNSKNVSMYPKQCINCLRTYNTKQSFQQHRCNSKESIKCDICERSFLSKASFFNHKRSCKKSQSNKQVMKEPCKQYPKRCNKCKKLYSSKQSFSNHNKTCSKISIPSPEISPVNPACKEIVSLNPACKEIVSLNPACKEIVPLKSACKEIASTEPDCSNVSLVKPAAKTCEKCNLSFYHKRSFRKHLTDCTKLKHTQFDCIYECPKSFARFASLVKHLFWDHGIDCLKHLTFDSIGLFQKWLENESSSTFSSFTKYTGTKSSTHNKYYYYSCQFGKYHTQHVPVTSRKNNKGTIPKFVNCPARI